MTKLIPEWLRHQPVFANVAEGIHTGSLTRPLNAALTHRYRLVKPGASTEAVELCGTSDKPLGINTDSGSEGDLINVELPGNTATTLLVTAAEALDAGSDLYTAGAGKVQGQPGTAGTYYHIGQSLTAATGDGDVIEFTPNPPRKTVVMSAFTGNTNTDMSLLSVALQKAPDRIISL